MILVSVKETGATPRIALRKLNEINREVMRDMGDHWHAHMRAKHFTRAGATEYGYAPRQGEPGRTDAMGIDRGKRGFYRTYTGRKLKKFGHTRPLTYTGQTEQQTSIKDIRTVATKGEGKARVILHAPTLNYRYKGSRIDMRKEMTTVSEREGDELAGVCLDSKTRRFNALNDTSTTTIG